LFFGKTYEIIKSTALRVSNIYVRENLEILNMTFSEDALEVTRDDFFLSIVINYFMQS
jgi:hypothetical protein